MMKLVREKLFEIKRGEQSGLSSIGVGKTALIKNWLDKVGITNYKIKQDGTIDVVGDVNFGELFDMNQRSSYIEALPDYIQFGTVYGNFDITGCALLHLKGCPVKVTGSFYCQDNDLSSLDFCPKFVRGEFVCYGNSVTFKKSDVESRCQVLKGIHVTDHDYEHDKTPIPPEDVPSANTRYIK